MWQCSVDGCDRPHYGRGWCDRHYRRWYRHGGAERIKRRAVTPADIPSAPMTIPRRLEADDLGRLRLLAAEFDREADGGCWPATRFVEWVEMSLRDPSGHGQREAVQARGQAEDRWHR